jgi:23S rRNA pseudouridine1911/1915/1917 synthase
MRHERLTGEPGRVDAVVARLGGIGRADVHRAIDAGRLTVDGRPVRKSHRLSGGERIELELTDEQELAAEGPDLPVLWEDDHLMVVSKPSGMVTHPTERRREGTLVNRLLGMGRPLSSAGGPLRPGIVHRLDAGTSGLLIVAKDDATHEAVAHLLRAHAVDRRYLALVRGSVPHERFAVDAPLGRRAARIVVDPAEGRDALTRFSVRERFGGATLLEAAPRTGRTHQIRVHLASIGHPILGDRTYGGMGDEARAVGVGRPFLHAWRLAFDHPVSGVSIEVVDPLPDDLSTVLEQLSTRRRSPRQQRP